MKRTLLLILGAAAVAAAQGASGQVPGECLDVVEIGPWDPMDSTQFSPNHWVPPPGEDAFLYAFPARVQLGPEPWRDGGWRELIIPEHSQQTPHAFRMWLSEGDSLLIALSSGFSGVHARLRREGAGWRGTLETRTDQGGILRYERTLGLTSADCDGPPPVAASEDRPFPRSVELAGGGVLLLGEPLPDGLRTELRPSGAFEVLAEAAGRFAGADTIVVVRGPRTGRVFHLELRYPAGFDFGGLLEDLEAELGARPRGSGIRMWENRTTRVQVFGAGASQRSRLLLIDPRYQRERP